MPAKYVSKRTPPKNNGWYEADATDSLAKTVFEAEPECVDTGLLDANGCSIYRVSEMDPIGYVINKSCK